MGKGDIKTKRGKIVAGSYGVRRRSKKARKKTNEPVADTAKKAETETKPAKKATRTKKSADQPAS